MSEKSENNGIPQRLEDLTKPDLVKKEKRTEKITINLTKTEKEEIVRLSKKYGLRMSPFLRFKGLTDFTIARGRGIERIKQENISQDPIMIEMKKGFSQVINEIKRGFKQGRKFLKPIPAKDKKEILKYKQERKKGVI